jgi:hypothetical protein
MKGRRHGQLDVANLPQTRTRATHGDTPLLTDPQQEEPSHPEVVTHLDTLAGSDLELPLSGHDLGVDTRDLDPSVKTSALWIPNPT